MGTFQLGALLGANQSFEEFETLPTSWLSLSDRASFKPNRPARFTVPPSA